jgi:hypothetical protein
LVPGVIGKYIFDVMLLKMAGVAQKLLCIDDFASDALVLHRASHATVGKLLDFDAANVGNKIVSFPDVLMCWHATNSNSFRCTGITSL